MKHEEIMEKATPAPWEARIPKGPCTFSRDGGETFETVNVPPHVVRIYTDEQGRRCRQFVCGEFAGAGLPNDVNAQLVVLARNAYEPMMKELTRLLDVVSAQDAAIIESVLALARGEK